MHLSDAATVVFNTHFAALKLGHRPNAIEIVSGPGLGKSSMVPTVARRLAAATNAPVGFLPFMLATVQSVDIRGFMLPQKGEGGKLDTVFSTPPWYPTAANSHKVDPDGTWHRPGTWTGPVPDAGILFLDEWGQADDDCKKAAADLMLNGCVGATRLPSAWRVIAASNRMSDRSGVVRPMAFITNRRMELNVTAHLPSWITYQEGLPVEERAHFYTLSFAQKNSTIVFRDTVPAEPGPFCTPRSLCLMDKDLKSLRNEDDARRDRMPLDNIAREVAASWIGEGAAAQYFVHLKFADELPDVADMIDDPTGCKCPTVADAQLVAAYMASGSLGPRNGSAIMKFIARLRIDMQTLAVRAMTARPDQVAFLSNTREFTAWVDKHRALLIASQA